MTDGAARDTRKDDRRGRPQCTGPESSLSREPTTSPEGSGAPDTSTPESARAHARSLAESAEARNTRTRPTIPAWEADSIPPGVVPTDVVWDETLGAGGYAARTLERGSRVRITNLEGDACVSLFAFNADEPRERLNVADTVKVQWQAYLGPGSVLLSDMGRVLLSFELDDAGRHDALCGSSNAMWNQRKYGKAVEGLAHGTGAAVRDRVAIALAKQGLGRRDIGPNVNLFKSVRVGPDGSLSFDARPGRAGECVVLRSDMRVLLVLVNAPHVLDPRTEYVSTRVRVTGWRGVPADEQDPIRTSTPERLRAYQNVEDYYGDRPGSSAAPPVRGLARTGSPT